MDRFSLEEKNVRRGAEPDCSHMLWLILDPRHGLQVRPVFLIRNISGIQAFPVVFRRLVQVFFHTQAQIIKITKAEYSGREFLFRRQGIVFQGFGVILLDRKSVV